MVPFLAVLFITKVVGAQFLELPAAKTIFVPINNRVNFSCSVEEGYRIDWEVRFSNGDMVEAANAFHRNRFIQRNFNFTGVATRRSTLSFGILDESGRQANNATNISCIAQQGIDTRVGDNISQVVLFYDAPPPPTDLSVFLNISWSLNFIEGVPVNYTLNLNTTSAQPIITGLLDQHYVFETSRPCDVYSFTVTAVTAAGNSTPSQEFIFTRNDSIDMCPSTVTTSGAVAGIVIGIVGIIAIVVIFIAISVILTWKIFFNSVTADVISLNSAKRSQATIVPLTVKTYTKPIIQCSLQLSRNDSIVEEAHVDKVSSWKRNIVVTPHQHGRHKLGITVNGQHIKGSPFHFEVEVLFREFNCKVPIGLTTSQERVFVLEEGSKEVKVFEGLEQKDPITLNLEQTENNLAEITAYDGQMFVTTGIAGKVLKIDSTGTQKGSIELKGRNGPMRPCSNGLGINRNELYVCDSQLNKIEVFDLELKYRRTIPGKKKKCKSFKTPRDVAFDGENRMYVAESTRIQVISHDGNFIRTIGKGKLTGASGLKIVGNSLFVASEGGVSLYSIYGTHIRDFYKATGSNRPLGITVDNNGYVYVSTSGEKVLIFS